MANIVNVDRVSKAYGTTILLDEVSLGVDDGDRIGVVGLNGAGKTTLLRLLISEVEPDAGRVSRRRGAAVAHLPQNIELPATATVHDVVLGDAWQPATFAAEHEWAGDAAIRDVLAGLGMPYLGLDNPVGPMSGGERRRVALAALLVRAADLLILDEPTNHLDLAGIRWLADWLVERKQALVVVTHDRWFLDEVCTRTWEVADGQVRAAEGGYAEWVLARAERERLAAAAEQRRVNLVRKELAWLRRGPPARTSKPRYRVEAARELIADVPPPRDSVALQRLATARLGKKVYELENVTLRPGAKVLLDGVTARIGPGDRIGLLGANGSGKTTLLRALAGQRAPESGEVVIGQTVRAAFLSQELTELPAALRMLEAVEEVARRFRMGDRELSASQLAETFGFSGQRQWTPVGDLSGGERRRLQLLRLLAGEPNVLLLDEPTNDLDTDTLASLEDMLDGWPGTLVVASHDRYLIERVCDIVLALRGDGQLAHLPGGVDEYLRGLPTETAAGGVPPKETVNASTAGEARAARKELARLERSVAKLTEREAKLHDRLAANATDYEKITELDAELRDVRAEREKVEEEWLALAEQVE